MMHVLDDPVLYTLTCLPGLSLLMKSELNKSIRYEGCISERNISTRNKMTQTNFKLIINNVPKLRKIRVNSFFLSFPYTVGKK